MTFRAAIGLFALAAWASACADGRPRAPISEGQRLYLAKCTSCHSAWEPAKYSPTEWRKNLDEMIEAKKVTLSAEERAEILGYLGGASSNR